MVKTLNLKYNEIYNYPKYIVSDFEVESNTSNFYNPDILKIPVNELQENGILLIWFNGEKTKYDFTWDGTDFTISNGIDLKLQNFKVDNKPDKRIVLNHVVEVVDNISHSYEIITNIVNINGVDVEISNESPITINEPVTTLFIKLQLEEIEQIVKGRIQLIKQID